MAKMNRLKMALVAMVTGAFFLAPAADAKLTGDFAQMNEPLAPFRIADNLYYVGAKDVTSYLIVTKAGLIVLDGGFAETAPEILANIRTLGFDPKHIRILLNSHAHLDHAGGLAALKAESGATFYASAPDAPVLAAGGANDFALKGATFPPIKADKIIADGGTVTLGGVTLTAHVTAGHTKGCTTWTMPVMVDSKPQGALFLCSLSILSTYRLIGDPNYPTQAADYQKSFATLKGLKCDVFLASHGSFFGMLAKREKLLAGAKPNPFIDPEGCRAFVATAEAEFDRRLALATHH
ncbi:MAG TPA: subclass B3 metallo-beta-lactamase [Bradyrhizobium sp.]